jgi:hypothetical protein
MNWQAVPQRVAFSMRETPQSVHRPRGAAAGKGGANTAVGVAAPVNCVSLPSSAGVG